MELDNPERFWQYVRQSPGCWFWTGGKSREGYGTYYLGRDASGRKRFEGAHRHAYELLRGPIPEGLHLDHLCRNPSCVRPDHLEPVTVKENLLRGNTVVARNAAVVACPYGHPYDEQNTLTTRNGRSRQCRVCNRRRRREWYAKKRASNARSEMELSRLPQPRWGQTTNSR